MYRYFLWAAIGFISGSILYSYHIPKIFKGIDITEVSSDGNPGTSNAFKYAGVPIGIICLALDLSKGFFPIALSLFHLDANNILFSVIVAAPVLGHATALLYPHISGGKAIAVSFGVLLALIPHSYIVLFLAAAYIFFSVVHKINPHEMRTVITFLLFSAVSLSGSFYTGKFAIGLSAVAVSAIVIAKNMHDAVSGKKADAETLENEEKSKTLIYAKNTTVSFETEGSSSAENR